MYAEVHVLTGIVLQQASDSPLGLSCACVASVGSHVLWDSFNMSTYTSVYHGLGTGWRKWVMLGARAALWCWLVCYLWHHPAFLVCGLAAWGLDLDHVFNKGRIHHSMFRPWLQSEWGLLIVGLTMVMLAGIVLA